MIERERHTIINPLQPFTHAATETFPRTRVVPVKSAFPPSATEHDHLIALRACFDEPLQRLERLQRRLHRTSQPAHAISVEPGSQLHRPQRVRSEHGLLLQATLRYLDRVEHVPLLKAPIAFEVAFAPFEPMFHTIFFRKYPHHLQADAKQEALLRLWLQWRQDTRLLEQTASFIVQAALWGASPWGKKRAKVEARELPMPRNERAWEAHTPQPTRDPTWVERIDRKTDVQLAIERVQASVRQSDDATSLEIVLQDVVSGTCRAVGQRQSGLSIRTYKRHRDWVENALREALADYRPCQ